MQERKEVGKEEGCWKVGWTRERKEESRKRGEMLERRMDASREAGRRKDARKEGSRKGRMQDS